MVKNTNTNILKALSHEKPNSSYAQLFGYSEDNGRASFSKKVDFTRFSSEPTIANEFLNDFFNKIVAQHVQSQFEKDLLNEKYGIFLKTYGKVGDIEEYITTKLTEVKDYEESNTNPFEINKPKVVLSFIKTEDKIYDFITLNYEQWYGAFINEGGLNKLAGQILSELKTAIDNYIYDTISTDLSDESKFTIKHTLPTIAGLGDSENSKKAYEDIILLKSKMSLRSKIGEYNLGGLENNGTPESEMVLLLNADYSASFDVNVLASLFNSEKIKLETRIIQFDTTKNKNIVGMLMDRRAYVFGYRINFSQSIMNPRNMYVNTFNHRWVKRGVLPIYNAVMLVTADTTASD